MLILLSPAKLMNFETGPDTPAPTRPELMDRAATLSKTTRNLTRAKIKQMMGLSDDLAQLNYERFKAFDLDANDGGKPALLTFNGEVYRGLDAKTLTAKDMDWAQTRVRMLSGLYGVLRPLDAIQPYRLEMGTKIKTRRGQTLYDYWGSDIADTLNGALDGQKDRTILNLASNEYFKAVDRKALDANVIDVSFKEIKDGKARSLFMFVKVARGLMTRWVIDNRIDDPARLKEFNIDGYTFDADASTNSKLEFTRPQPAPKR